MLSDSDVRQARLSSGAYLLGQRSAARPLHHSTGTEHDCNVRVLAVATRLFERAHVPDGCLFEVFSVHAVHYNAADVHVEQQGVPASLSPPVLED